MEDIQKLLERINREGVQKAESEASRIISEAKAEAADIVKNARMQAEKSAAEAAKNASDYSARAEATIRQAARDIVLNVNNAIVAQLEKILTVTVERALGDDTTAVALVAEAIASLAGNGEIHCAEKLAAALQSKLASSSFKIVTDDFTGAGFTVRTNNGRVEHDFTSESVAAELAKRLRPDLAKLVK